MPEERAATGIAVLAAWERTSEREEPRARTAFMAQKKEEKEEDEWGESGQEEMKAKLTFKIRSVEETQAEQAAAGAALKGISLGLPTAASSSGSSRRRAAAASPEPSPKAAIAPVSGAGSPMAAQGGRRLSTEGQENRVRQLEGQLADSKEELRKAKEDNERLRAKNLSLTAALDAADLKLSQLSPPSQDELQDMEQLKQELMTFKMQYAELAMDSEQRILDLKRQLREATASPTKKKR